MSDSNLPQVAPETAAAPQEEDRSGFYGGSDIATIMRVSRWKTPLRLFREKKKLVQPQPVTLAMRRGTALEPVVFDVLRITQKANIYKPSRVFVPDHPHRSAAIDGIKVTTKNGKPWRRLQEVKTTDYDIGWGPEKTDRIPVDYLVQVQWYLGIALLLGMVDDTQADVILWVSGEEDFREYVVDFDPELFGLLCAETDRFHAMVLENRPPPPRTQEDLESLVPVPVSRSQIYADEGTQELVYKLVAVKALKKLVEEEESRLSDSLRVAFGEHEDMLDLSGSRKPIATFRKNKDGVSFDEAAFAAVHPELYAQFLVHKKGARTLLLKPKMQFPGLAEAVLTIMNAEGGAKLALPPARKEEDPLEL